MIKGGMAYQFLRDQFNGLHDLENDTIFFAMYTTLASLDRRTVNIFDNTNELVGTSYPAGGVQITQTIIGGPPDITSLDIDDLTFTAAVWGQTAGTAAFAAVLYNQTQANKVIAVIPFGSPQVVNGGNFIVRFPNTTDPSLVIIRGVA